MIHLFFFCLQHEKKRKKDEKTLAKKNRPIVASILSHFQYVFQYVTYVIIAEFVLRKTNISGFLPP